MIAWKTRSPSVLPSATFLAPLTSHTDESPGPRQFVTVKRELQAPAHEARARIFERSPAATVPEQHGTSAVLPRRNETFKVCIVDRMVFHLNGEALLRGIETRTLGHGPAFQGSILLQTKVIVQTTRRMLLNHVQFLALSGPDPTAWFRRLFEIPFLPVGVKTHGFPAGL